jgi:hypothetical protein
VSAPPTRRDWLKAASLAALAATKNSAASFADIPNRP